LPPAGYNGSQYCNAAVDEMVAQSLVEPDAETRRAMWYEISEITNDELLHLTMFQQDRRHAINQNVCNYQFLARHMSDGKCKAHHPELEPLDSRW